MADLLLNDGEPTADDIDIWCGYLAPYLIAEAEASGRDHDQMLRRLAGWTVDPWHQGRKWLVSQIVAAAAGRNAPEDEEQWDISTKKAQAALKAFGLAVVKPNTGELKGKLALAIALDHPGLNRIFLGTKWAGGVWSQSAARVPGALEFAEAKDGGKPRIKQRFGGKPEPCILVPVEAMIGEKEGAPN